MQERDPAPLAPEAMVELQDEAGVLARWFCTPERLDELAAGWLRGEGRAATSAEVGPIDVDPAAGIVRLLAPTVDPRRAPGPPPAGPTRAPSSLDALFATPDTLRGLYKAMFDRGALRERSGGVHTGALVESGEVSIVREDVSRHCVLDKLIGRRLLDDRDLDDTVVLLSGRISGALAAKGARAGVAVMATMSIPTTLAAEIAARAGMTLIGRARAVEPHLYLPGS